MNSVIKKLLEIPQHEQRSPEWFAQRREKLTSSDAASVIEINPYGKYHELLFKKCGLDLKPFVGNIATLHGQKYEDEAIEKYCRIMGKRNYNFGCISYTDVHTTNLEHSFLAGSPDGIVESVDNVEDEPILLEVKCPFRRKIIDGYIPAYYVPQVQLNLFICNLKIADFIEYCPKTNKLNIVRIYKDDKWLNKYLPIFKEFWNEVLYYREHGIDKHIKYKEATKEKKPRNKIPKKQKQESTIIIDECQENEQESLIKGDCMIVD